MSGLDKNRLRNQTVCFRATPEERQQIEARITVSGMSKGQYYIQSLLHQQINIIVGKYQSDRLSLEIRRLRERLDELNHIAPHERNEVLTDCKALLEQLAEIMENNSQEEKITIEDFATEK
jgi:hypothetical protein